MQRVILWTLRAAGGVYLLLFPGIIIILGIEARHEHSVSTAATPFTVASLVATLPLVVVWALHRWVTRRLADADVTDGEAGQRR